MALNRMNCFSNLKNLEKPRKMPKGAKSPKSHDRLFGLLFGGGRGIRTPVGLLPNGFQDRLVMTTSIYLRIILKKRIFAENGFKPRPFRKYSRIAHSLSLPSMLLIFVTRFKKRLSIVFCSLTRYDHFDIPANYRRPKYNITDERFCQHF